MQMKTAPGKKILTPAQALEKLRKYCTYQERCQQEVRYKLLESGQRGIALENIIVALIEENFLNEERFAVAYARGKFRMKGWGKTKIKQSLKFKGVSDYCINKAMKEIEAGDYEKTFMQELQKKSALIKGGTMPARQQKLAAHLIRKGYEPELVWEAVKKVVRT